MREIRFKRAYFSNEDKTGFLGFKEWGVNIDESVFTAPTNKSNSMSFIDYRFTGLRDKNGKECYDGDIYKNGENGLIGLMEYQNSLGGYLLYANEKKDGSQYTFRPFHEMDNTDIEIIGNIHQNKELLK